LTMERFTGKPEERDFLDQVITASGQNLLECLQCGKCTGSCPIASDVVAGPRRLIALVLSGMKQAALEDRTWWYCVSCGTCAGRCPVEINMYRVATALCEMAEDEGIRPAEPAIHRFEQLFLNSVEKAGRVQELKTVMALNMRSLNPFKDAAIGTKMLLKGAVSPKEMVHKPQSNPAVARIFRRVREATEGK
jgi:heterodisulfide reductase subunit C